MKKKLKYFENLIFGQLCLGNRHQGECLSDLRNSPMMREKALLTLLIIYFSFIAICTL